MHLKNKKGNIKMKKRRYVERLSALAFWIGLIPLLGVPFDREATAQSPVTLTVYDPTGAFQVSQTFAPRLADLNGKTICELSDDSWEAPRTFPAIRLLLQKLFPTVKFVTSDQFPTILTGTDVSGLEDVVKAKGCQGAIVGNAG